MIVNFYMNISRREASSRLVVYDPESKKNISVVITISSYDTGNRNTNLFGDKIRKYGEMHIS